MNKKLQKFYDRLREDLRRDAEEQKKEREVLDNVNQGDHIISEWHQAEDRVNELPKELEDLKVAARFALCQAISGEEEIPDMAIKLNRSIEAAYNLGKQQPK